MATAGAIPDQIKTQRILLESRVDLQIEWDALTLEQSGGLPVTNYYVKSDESNFILGAPIAVGTQTTFSKLIDQVDVGKVFRFRVAAENELGVGPFSNEIQLLATDAPGAPSMIQKDSSRTLNSIDFVFTAPVDNGGSPITGYELWRDQGVSGSPFERIYDGSGKPEMLVFSANSLITSLTYTFKLYSLNKIFRSETSYDLVLKIGMVPSKPGAPTYEHDLFSPVSATEAQAANIWLKPSADNGWPITSYTVWLETSGVWEATILPVDQLELIDSSVRFTN